MATIDLSAARSPLILVVDIGSSSLRVVLYDAQAREVEGTLARRTYSVRTSEDGGAELDAEAMFDAFTAALDELLAKTLGTELAGIAASSLAANVLGIDAEGRAITPAYLYSDTRAAAAVQELRELVDWSPIYARTGCPLHTSYLPARFLWLKHTQPDMFARAAHWLSLHEFFLLKLFGRSIVSHSLASWTGLLNRVTLDWDDEVLTLAGVRRGQLSPLASAHDSLSGPSEEFRARWKQLVAARFFPAIGDGAAANLGSGCTDVTRVALTIGTSGALRVVVPGATEIKASRRQWAYSGRAGGTANVQRSAFQIPRGLWLYRVDERRGLLGGSLNNGGNVFAYLQRTLQLTASAETELAALEPDAHGLTVLPFFAGERSPGYHGDARASIVGWNLETSPVEILRACYEAIAYRIAAIYDLLREGYNGFVPRAIIASGSALFHSPAWVQILADVLGQPITVSGEAEATARGAALLALEAVGAIGDVSDLTPAFGQTVSPHAAYYDIYLRARERQQRLYSRLIEE
jgi:gluconokinase